MRAALKAVYGVTELADMAGMSRHQVYRWVKKTEGLVMGPRARREKIHVALTSFQEAFPEVWDSIIVRCSLSEQ